MNYRVLYDSAEVGWVTSGHLFADQAAARGSGLTGGHAAFWPPRV